MERVSRLIIQTLKTIVEVPGTRQTPLPNYKCIDALLPYAIRLEQGGQREMIDAIVLAAKGSVPIFRWHCIGIQVAAVFDKSSPPSLDRVLTLISPYVPWHNRELYTGEAVTRWAAAVSAVPYSAEVGQSVAETLLQISSQLSLQPHIPVDVWAWLKKRPLLPPACQGRSGGSSDSVVRQVRGLGDIEILKSYLLLVWSEWNDLHSDGWFEMQTLIREDFDGIGMRCHREDLIEHLDRVQGQLERGSEYFKQHEPLVDEGRIQWRKETYGELKSVLLDVDKTAMGTLTRTPPTLILLDLRTDFCGCVRNPFNFHLCSASSVTVISLSERSVSLHRAHTWTHSYCKNCRVLYPHTCTIEYFSRLSRSDPAPRP